MTQDDSTEHIREEIQHHAEHGGHAPSDKWIAGAALTAAILAVLAAIGGTLAGMHLTESSRAQIQSNDDWLYYQAKSIKQRTVQVMRDVVRAMPSTQPAAADVINSAQSEIDRYHHDMAEAKEKAEAHEKSSEMHLQRHEVLERGVTLFHISIAIVAIAVLTKKKSFWYGSMACGAIGIVFLAQGLLH